MTATDQNFTAARGQVLTAWSRPLSVPCVTCLQRQSPGAGSALVSVTVNILDEPSELHRSLLKCSSLRKDKNSSQSFLPYTSAVLLPQHLSCCHPQGDCMMCLTGTNGSQLRTVLLKAPHQDKCYLMASPMPRWDRVYLQQVCR